MSTTSSGWTQAALVAGNAAVQGYTARKAAKEQKKVSQAAAQPRYEYQVRNPYMNELIAPLIPYILQSQQQVFQNRMKGYGSSAPDFSPFANLLAGITSNYSGVPQMGGGQTYGGKITSQTMPQSFPQGGAAGNNTAGVRPGVASGGLGGAAWGAGTDRERPEISKASLMDALESSDPATREWALNAMKDMPQTSLSDSVRNALWGYAGLDKNYLGKKGTGVGDLLQQGVKFAAGKLPIAGMLAGPLLNKADKTFGWMYDYKNWGRAPQGVWDISPHMVNSYLDAMGRSNNDPIMAALDMGYGRSVDDPLLSELFSSGKYSADSQNSTNQSYGPELFRASPGGGGGGPSQASGTDFNTFDWVNDQLMY